MGSATDAASSVTRGEPASDAPAAVSVSHLTKRFGARDAFADVSFAVRRGEVFGFLGPNGAGKTTMVRTLGTLLQPTSGSATVAGLPLIPANGVEIRRRTAVMPESPGLYLRLSVRENLECFAGLYQTDQPGRRIEAALAAVNLADRSADVCGTLSKGLRQRVALARALLSDPEILFLDEPTAALDPVAAREVHGLIQGLRERGVAIFLTTQRLEEAERLCDRVAILRTTLQTIGRPEDLRSHLFQAAIEIRTREPLADPERIFGGVAGVTGWRQIEPEYWTLSVTDPVAVAPVVNRALVGAGVDVISLGEARHSLEDVYLELIEDDPEVAP